MFRKNRLRENDNWVPKRNKDKYLQVHILQRRIKSPTRDKISDNLFTRLHVARELRIPTVIFS